MQLHEELSKNIERSKSLKKILVAQSEVGGQAVLGRQFHHTTPWLTERHGYDPT